MLSHWLDKSTMVSPADALPGREQAIEVTNQHAVNGQPIVGPFANGLQSVIFAMGCFWGAERRFWLQPGVVHGSGLCRWLYA